MRRLCMFVETAMKDPYEIKSKEYAEAWVLFKKFLKRKGGKGGLKDIFLNEQPDSVGTFKKAYFVKPKQLDRISVLLVEIGSEAFFQKRDALMKKLSKYASNEHMIIPMQLMKHTLQSEDGLRKYVVLVTEGRYCPDDLQKWVAKQREIDIIDLVSQFVALHKVLLEMLDDKLYFTDVKSENVIHCGDHLALIDLDSVLSEDLIFKDREVGSFTMPEAKQFARFAGIIAKHSSKYKNGREDEGYKEDILMLYKFYTLFAFSSMVFRNYIFITQGKDFMHDPKRLLSRHEDILREDLADRFPQHIEGHRSMQTLLLLSWHTLSFVYHENNPTKEMVMEVLDLWSDSEIKFRSSRERKERRKLRREDRLVPSRRRLLLL